MLNGRVRQRTRLLHAVLALGLTALGLLITEFAAKAQSAWQQQQAYEFRVMRTAQMRSRLESELNATVFLAHGFVAYIAAVRDLPPAAIMRALKALYESDPRIRNVGLAPDNVLQYIYPREGNEAALGLRYADHPDQWPSVQRVMQSRQSVLAGPVHLVQGGLGIISRTPVFLDDQRYWGLVSVVIDVDMLLRDVGMDNPDIGLRYTLYGDNAGADEARIFGRREPDTDQTIHMSIEVPGGVWTLVSNPTRQLPALGAGWVVRTILGAISLLLGAFAYGLLGSRARAQALARKLSRANRGLSAANEQLLRLSRRDALTQVLNRRAFDEAFTDAWRSCSRDQVPLAILMVDADHFKTINDRYGHAAGDATLIELASAIQSAVRVGDDIVARYGGEEFIVLAMDLSDAELAELAERIRRAAAQCRIQLPDPDAVGEPVTVSVGTAREIPDLRRRAQYLVQRADAALYLAKQRGRNCVVSGDAPDVLANLPAAEPGADADQTPRSR